MPSTPVDLSSLTLVRCTPAQFDVAAHNAHAEWGNGYSIDEFVEHMKGFTVNAKANGYAWGSNGQWVPWALVPRSDPGTMNMLAHCHTFRRDSLVLPPGSSTPEDVASYGIGAVFTPVYARKKGYARHMLRLLHYMLAPETRLAPFPAEWGAPPAADIRIGDARFSVLYSGIGEKFYADCTKGAEDKGWVHPRPRVVTREWKVPADDAGTEVAGAQWVERDGLGRVEAEMAKRIRLELSTTGDASKTRLAILPTGQLTFQVVFSDNKRPGSTNALFLPAAAGSDEQPFIAYALTLPDAGKTSTRLVITHVSHTAEARVPFSAVLAAAWREGATEVEHWGDAGWDAEGDGAKLLPDANCPCIAVYGLADDDVEWEWCEKYAWC